MSAVHTVYVGHMWLSEKLKVVSDGNHRILYVFAYGSHNEFM